MKKKLSFIATTLLVTSNLWAHSASLTTYQEDSASAPRWLTVDNKILERIEDKLGRHSLNIKTLNKNNNATVVQLKNSEIEKLSHLIHNELHRCGGFVHHESLEEALQALTPQSESLVAKKAVFADYTIDQQSTVMPMVNQVEETSIREMIINLSSFKNRYYKSQTGIQSSEFIRDTWAKLSAHRNDVTVELIEHKNWPQASIVMTIKGSEQPDEIVVLGGHADSIAGMWGGSFAVAPGADDNASGIATITEVIKILMNSNFRPKKTIQFMGYAAEEVGLLGSKEIAKNFKNAQKNVIGVMQLDMTLYKGTPDKDIVMMADFTNRAQNEFLGKLIDEYVKVPWGYSRCGYGCSDHASWTANGYPASIPFESTMEDINRKIHTANDTLEQSGGGTADHAVHFAKLATAFVVELSL